MENKSEAWIAFMLNRTESAVRQKWRKMTYIQIFQIQNYPIPLIYRASKPLNTNWPSLSKSACGPLLPLEVRKTTLPIGTLTGVSAIFAILAWLPIMSVTAW
ncbi:hypothetical protein E5D57_001698 [Metarhizium anisopliae]|nr:hypothetical protein E5D57_001698 [Metarhizium anisopliae]